MRERFAAQDRRLGLVAVGLDDGAATHRPPLAESLERLRGARFMILLLGEEYGEAVAGQAKSYVNLEYEAALETDGDVQVLAFGIGPSYAGGLIAAGDEPRMAEFRRQVQTNHTVRLFDGSENVDEQAAAIHLQLVYAAWDLHKRPAQAEDGFDSDIEPEDLAQDQDIESLEQRFGSGRSGASMNAHSVAEALAHPSELAAREQCREADAAIGLGKLRIARDHLRRAIELRPLDVEANYRLARLYIASRQRRYLGEAVKQLELVRQIFERDGQRYYACDCLLLQARAVIERGDSATALALADKACAELPGYGRARYEYSHLLLLAGRADAARRELLGAVKRHFPLWPQAQRDYRFDSLIERAGRDVGEWLRSHRDMARGTLDGEARIGERMGVGIPVRPALEEIRNPNSLARVSCASIRRQHGLVRTAFWQAVDALKVADRNVADSCAEQRIAEQRAVLRRHGQVAAELAAAQRTMPVMVSLTVLVAGVALVGLLSWDWLPWPFVFGILCLTSIALSLLIPVLMRPSPGMLRRELWKLDAQLQRMAVAHAELARSAGRAEPAEEAARKTQVLMLVFSSWCNSLLRQGRHQPYAEIADPLKPGDLLVADDDELDELRSRQGHEVVLRNLIDASLIGVDGEYGRRLYRVLEVGRDRLVLSEIDAYSRQGN
ncbi:tetratricopeptide repeat protein [Tahibacter caeni]|uniref:tetratricopeptide repeat protein n=1 Tax=Tahibacter caeni TaxID=1453545 RepID=UPI0021477B88